MQISKIMILWLETISSNPQSITQKLQRALQSICFKATKISHPIGTPTFGFPPRIMSVPLPAIFVEMVIANFRPA